MNRPIKQSSPFVDTPGDVILFILAACILVVVVQFVNESNETARNLAWSVTAACAAMATYAAVRIVKALKKNAARRRTHS